MATFRLTGILHSTGARKWDAREADPAKGISARSAGEMPLARVQLSAFSYTEVTVADGFKDKLGAVRLGEPVDLVVDVEAAGRYLRAEAVDFWPEPESAAKPLAVVGGKV